MLADRGLRADGRTERLCACGQRLEGEAAGLGQGAQCAPLGGLALHEVARRCIGRTFQEVKIFRELTVWENLILAALGYTYDLRAQLHPINLEMPLKTVGLRALTLSSIYSTLLIVGLYGK